METLEQYGIKDVTPGNSVGIKTKLCVQPTESGRFLELRVGGIFVGYLYDAERSEVVSGDERVYNVKDASLWLKEVN